MTTYKTRDPWGSLNTLDVREFNVGGDGITDDYAALVSAAAAVTTGRALYFPPDTYLIGTNLTLACPVVFDPGAVLKPASGVTVTLNGAATLPMTQCFDTSAGGSIAFGAGVVEAVLPQWFGAVGDGTTDDATAIQAAINALPTHGGVVFFPDGNYVAASSLSIASGTDGVTFRGVGIGAGDQNKTAKGSQLYFTGTSGDLLDIGNDTTGTNHFRAVDLSFNVAGGHAAACCIHGLRLRRCVWERCAFLTTRGGAALTGQTAVLIDGGTDFTGWVSFRDCNVYGDFTVGFDFNNTVNVIVIDGGDIHNTVTGAPLAGSIAVRTQGGHNLYVTGCNLEKWETLCDLTSDDNWISPARVEDYTTAVLVRTGSNSTYIFGGDLAPGDISNSASQLAYSVAMREDGESQINMVSPLYGIQQQLKSAAAAKIRHNLVNTVGSWEIANTTSGMMEFTEYVSGGGVAMLRLRPDGLQIIARTSAPSSPVNGMIAYADGTGWDPGSGAGFYGYESGSWVKL